MTHPTGSPENPGRFTSIPGRFWVSTEAMSREEGQDVHRLVLERTERASMIVISNRDTTEWPTIFDDRLLARSAGAATAADRTGVAKRPCRPAKSAINNRRATYVFFC